MTINLRGEIVWLVHVGESSSFVYQDIEDVFRDYPAQEEREWRYSEANSRWTLWPKIGPVRVFARKVVIK